MFGVSECWVPPDGLSVLAQIEAHIRVTHDVTVHGHVAQQRRAAASAAGAVLTGSALLVAAETQREFCSRALLGLAHTQTHTHARLRICPSHRWRLWRRSFTCVVRVPGCRSTPASTVAPPHAHLQNKTARQPGKCSASYRHPKRNVGCAPRSCVGAQGVKEGKIRLEETQPTPQIHRTGTSRVCA